MNSQTILVTGAAGFIGSHVAEHCHKLGFRVIGVDNLAGGFSENIADGVEFIKGDVTDGNFIKNLFATYKFTYVYHLAAYAAEGLSHFIRHYNYSVNLLGSIHLINQSVLSGVKCFIFTSSIAVYGTNQTPMTEESTPLPEDPYGISKYAVELDLKAAFHMFGMPYIIFRPHNVYGERQNTADKYRNVIGIFMNQAMTGQPMTLFGDGLQTRAFSYIDDVAPIIAKSPFVSAAYNEAFNIGADKPYSILELAEVISEEFGVKKNIIHLEVRKEVVHAYSSHDKVHSVFNPPASVNLRDGIRRMVSWAKERGPSTPTEFSNPIEVPLNMPPSWTKAFKE